MRKGGTFMKIKHEFADGDVEVDVLMNGRKVFLWNWTDWRGIMIRRKDAGTIRLMRVCSEGIVYASEGQKILRQF